MGEELLQPALAEGNGNGFVAGHIACGGGSPAETGSSGEGDETAADLHQHKAQPNTADIPVSVRGLQAGAATQRPEA